MKIWIFAFFLCLTRLFSQEQHDIEKLKIPFDLGWKSDLTTGGILIEHSPIIFHPRNNQEIIQILDIAKKYQRKVRAIGSTHSLNPCCLTNGYVISLDQMNHLISIGQTECIVEAGIVIRDLCQALDSKGLTLGVVGAICEQTIAGAISTGTRGQVPKYGSLASLVTGIEIIDGQGNIHEFSLENDPDALHASVTSLGLLGIITKVKIKCSPLFLMAEIIRLRHIEEVIDQFELLMAHEKLIMYWNVAGDQVKIITGHKVDWLFPPEELSTFHFLGVYPHLHSMENFPDTLQRVGKSWDIISLLEWTDAKKERCLERIRKEGQAIFQPDYSIPIEDFPKAIPIIRDFFLRNKESFPLSKNCMVVEIRPVKKDHVWLSPSYERDSISLCFHDFSRGLQWNLEEAQGLIALENELKRHFDLRPHLGKAHFFNRHDLAKAFPRWEDLMERRIQADPDCLFVTEYLNTLLKDPQTFE